MLRQLESFPELQSVLQFKLKLDYAKKEPFTGIWGTLGWDDDSAFNLNGVLQFSNEGNLDGGGNYQLTKKEIEDLENINPLLDGRNGVVRERIGG